MQHRQCLGTDVAALKKEPLYVRIDAAGGDGGKINENNVGGKNIGMGRVPFKIMLFKKVLSWGKDVDSMIKYSDGTNRKEELLANGKMSVRKRYSVIKGNGFKYSGFFLLHFPSSLPPSLSPFLLPFLPSFLPSLLSLEEESGMN